MSTYDATPAAPAPTRAHRWVIPTLVALVALGAGFALGTLAGRPGDAPEAVERAPQSCLDALDQADDILDVSGQVSDLVIDHMKDDKRLFEQFARFDFTSDWYLANQNAFASDITDLSDRVAANTYRTHSGACRATATATTR